MQSSIKYRLLVLLILSCAALSPLLAQEKEPVKEENVDTMWKFAKYLGGKLGDELKERLNLNDEEAPVEKVKVKIKVWRYEMELEEERTKSSS